MDDRSAPADAEAALLELLQRLDAEGYDFVTPTPVTHGRVVARALGRAARDMREALGWSLPFHREDLPRQVVDLLDAAGLLKPHGEMTKAEVRVSRVRGLLFLHSAYPTEAADAVFLGPDSYRFADFVAAELAGRSWVGRLVDVGGGAGVGAITAAAGRGRTHVVLTDVNPKALRLARANAAHAGVPVETRKASGLDTVEEADLILANPPYIADAGQTYQQGGGLHGGEISLDWARQALGRLSPGGRFLLYTGSAILAGGHDALKSELQAVAEEHGAKLAYRELDPDVFGEQLDKEAYADVERIAAVGAVFTRPRAAGHPSGGNGEA